MRHIFHVLAVALLLSACPAAAEEDFLASFVLGDYVIVGREPNNGVAYSGTAQIELKAEGLVLKRRLKEREITAEGELEVPSPPGEGSVLRFRWRDPKPMLMSCQIDSDLDNYARLTCLWARQDGEPGEPGLEAMFPKKGTRKPIAAAAFQTTLYPEIAFSIRCLALLMAGGLG